MSVRQSPTKKQKKKKTSPFPPLQITYIHVAHRNKTGHNENWRLNWQRLKLHNVRQRLWKKISLGCDVCFIINGTWAAHVASCSYLLAAHPGGRCPKSGGTWWCWQPASQRRWGGKAPTPACPDPDAESAPDCWTAAALDHTNAKASPEHTYTWRNIKIVGGRITCTLPHLKTSRNVRILLSSHFESSNRSEFLLFWRCSS